MIARALVSALQAAGHEAGLLLTPQNRFGRQGGAYLANWLTDAGLAHDGRPVDQVISMRFPSYAVRHRTHACWLNHRMREYYDRWDAFSRTLSPRARLKERARRRLVHAADRYLLARRVTRVFAQSRTVQARLRRWGGIASTVVYPPPPPPRLPLRGVRRAHPGRIAADGAQAGRPGPRRARGPCGGRGELRHRGRRRGSAAPPPAGAGAGARPARPVSRRRRRGRPGRRAGPLPGRVLPAASGRLRAGDRRGVRGGQAGDHLHGQRRAGRARAGRRERPRGRPDRAGAGAGPWRRWRRSATSPNGSARRRGATPRRSPGSAPSGNCCSHDGPRRLQYSPSLRLVRAGRCVEKHGRLGATRGFHHRAAGFSSSRCSSRWSAIASAAWRCPNAFQCMSPANSVFRQSPRSANAG